MAAPSPSLAQALLDLDDERQARAASRILIPSLLIVAGAVALSLTATDARVARVFDNVYWTVSYVASAALAWLGARAAGKDDRRPKEWFAWALTLYAAGQVLWDLQVASGWNPFPGPSDVFFICLGPLTGLGWLGLLSRREGRAERRTPILDSAGLSVAVLALTLALYLPKRGALELLPLAFLVAYPVVLCWAACTALAAVLALRLQPSRGLLLFAIGLFGNGGLWLEWNRLTLDNALADGTALNALFPVCALAQGTGALLLRTQASSSKRWDAFCEGALRLLPLAIVVVCALAVVLAFTLPHVPAPVRWSALVGGLLVVVIATLRQSLLLDERQRLIETERELRKAEETFRVMVEQATDGIFIANAQGTYQDVNTRGAEMLGLRREEVIGMSIAEVVIQEDLARIGPELSRLLAGENVHSTWTFRRKDGSSFQGEVTATQLPDGRLQGFVRDASERLALEAQLRQSQKMEATGVLAAGIAHDFNNLLTAIRGNASLAANDLPPDHAAASSVADIELAATRASELVQRILAFSSPRPPASAEVDLGALIDEVVKLLRSSVPAGIELRWARPAASCVVPADPAQFHQVLMNLATNAWHALDTGKGTIEIRLASRRLYGDELDLGLAEGNYACVSVSDTGHGMSPATQERIFEPFFTTKAPGKGTGLGLSVVHGIVQGHRGALRVKSSPGSGSTFSLYLPAAVSAVREHPKGRDDAKTAVPSSLARVAYVDDEPQVQTVMVRLLQRRGYPVRGFGSAEELLTELRASTFSFEVLVTDYNMPRMSGLDLVRSVRELGHRFGAVVTSGYVSPELREAAERLGVARLVAKPETIERLAAAIDAAAAEASAAFPASERPAGAPSVGDTA